MSICNCSINTTLSEVGLGSQQNIGPIRRLFFQKKNKEGVRNVIDPAVNNPTLKATWDALIAAADETKVVTSPFIEEMATTPAEALTYERSDQSKVKLAEGAYSMTFKIPLVDMKTINALKELECEVNGKDGLQMFMISQCGGSANIVGSSSDDLVNNFTGFTVTYLSIDSSISDFSLTTPQAVNVEINLYPDWAKDLAIVEPSDFNALELQ